MRATIPSNGQSPTTLLAEMASFRDEDIGWREGRSWSLVYFAGDAHHELVEQAHNLFLPTNGLNPTAFKSLKRMEMEVVQMTADLLHGGDEAVGTMTSGGTESILLAVKAARDRARRHRPWVRRPNIVAPTTLHVAFDKAAHLFGLRVKRARIDANGQADLKHMRRLIDRNTVLLAASAPQYPHGSVDPIGAIGVMAEKRDIPFHVDACFGGFLLPWIEKLGRPIPVFDFRVPGVTSMSADLHKYGYAAKGASVVVYRSMDLLKHQFFVSTDWPGGIYISPTMAGTRPGGPIAAAWAALNSLGEQGYLDLTRRACETADRLRLGIEGIEGLRLMGLPHSTIVTYTSDTLDIYAVADQLQNRGWGVDRQQDPACIHCTVTANNAEVVDRYLQELSDAVAQVRAHPELSGEGDAAIYGLMSKVPLRGLVKHSVLEVMEQMYSPEGGQPELSGGEQDGPLLRAVHKLNGLLRGL